MAVNAFHPRCRYHDQDNRAQTDRDPTVLDVSRSTPALTILGLSMMVVALLQEIHVMDPRQRRWDPPRKGPRYRLTNSNSCIF